jgi:hypothetical protein
VEEQYYRDHFEPPKSKRRGIIIGCAIAAIFCMAVVIALSIRGWRAFVAFGIASDLTEYHAQISDSGLDEVTEKRLLDRIERIRTKMRDKPIGFFRWISYSDSIETLLRDGVLDSEEVRTMERELESIEKEIDETG